MTILKKKTARPYITILYSLNIKRHDVINFDILRFEQSAPSRTFGVVVLLVLRLFSYKYYFEYERYE